MIFFMIMLVSIARLHLSSSSVRLLMQVDRYMKYFIHDSAMLKYSLSKLVGSIERLWRGAYGISGTLRFVQQKLCCTSSTLS